MAETTESRWSIKPGDRAYIINSGGIGIVTYINVDTDDYLISRIDELGTSYDVWLNRRHIQSIPEATARKLSGDPYYDIDQIRMREFEREELLA